MPVYGLGTWGMGNDRSEDAGNVASMKTALEHGVTHIDTAEVYADGHAEELVGEAIKGADREKLLIVSKVHPDRSGFTAAGVASACEGSLRRLGTEYLDVYLLHRANPSGTPVEETVGALEKLVERGLIKHYGVSNHATESMLLVEDCGPSPVVTNQVHYNLTFREPEETGLLAACQEQDVLLTAWRPVQKGAFTDPPPILAEMAEKYVKTPTQVALNWLISQKNVTAIAKTSDPAHLEENLGALGWSMSVEDIERLRVEYPDQQPVSDVVPLA